MPSIVSTSFSLNIILAVLVFALLVLLAKIVNDHEREKQLYGKGNIKENQGSIVRNNRFLRGYNRTLNRFYTERGKGHFAPVVFYVTLFVGLVLAVYFVHIGQVFLAVLTPVVIVLIANKIFKMLLIDETEKVDLQLPIVIDNIIKVFSRYGDLKTVIYEASLSIEDPLKTKFERMARRMLSENEEKVMADFAEEMDNIWIHSLVVILQSYKDDTKKEDVILNLRHLAGIVDKENSLNNSSVTDKKYGVVLNYAIAIFAFLGGIAQLIFNPIGKAFFFGSMAGILCFLIGMACVVITIVVNLKLSFRRRRAKK